jgi:hypothetical protein
MLSESNSGKSAYNGRMNTNLLELRDAAAQVGEAVYDEQVRQLEAEESGKFVAIYLPTREYFVETSLIDAADRLYQKYPRARPGEVYTRRIGERPVIFAHTPRIPS